MSPSLVSYSDSDDEDELKAQSPVRKTAELPPLPPAFHDLYSTNARTSTTDNPSLHGGRKRASPHVDGNWPSHVYLEWVPSHAEAEQLLKLINLVKSAIDRANNERAKPLPVPNISPSLTSPLGTPLPLHISLSRTLQIKTDNREPFFETLASSLRKSAVQPFGIRFGTLKWVPNFQRNRWFLVLGVERQPGDELNRLLHACNEACGLCGHPGLYVGGEGDGPMEQDEDGRTAKRRKTTDVTADNAKETSTPCRVDRSDKFHISVAWNLTEPAPEWIDLVRNIDVGEVVKPPRTPFEAVKVKIGNSVRNLNLGIKTPSTRKGNSILGLD